MHMSFHRRAFLAGALALPLTACAKSSPAAKPSPSPSIDTTPLSALEKKYDARLGVYATTASGAVAFRADERFAFCSTFKMLAAAAVLQRHPLSYLDTTVRYTKAEVNSISPITEKHTAMTIRELCDAAIRYSDGTAGNLLMRDAGGPAQLTAYFRTLGDTTSRMGQYEPELNADKPGDPRDTTTPRAIAGLYRQIVIGTALPTEKQALIKDWLLRITTGGRSIRAGVPSGWTVANKTGSGNYGRVNDVAVAWPAGRRPPLVIAIMADRTGYATKAPYPMIAAAAKYVTSVLR